MTSIQSWVEQLLKASSASIRRFTAIIFIIFLGGMLIGGRIMQTNASLFPTAVIVPLFLAIVSYFYTEAAVAFFLVFALIFILL